MRRLSVAYIMRNPQIALATCLVVSTAVLASAFAFEHLGGLAPCKLCIWQRWPHGAVIFFTLIGLMRTEKRPWLAAAGLSALTTSGIGLHHVGVEQKWWQGLSGCSSQISAGLDLSDLTDTLLAMPVVKCDEIAWQFLSVSMAGWNMLVSAGITILVLLVILQPTSKPILTEPNEE